ncbi:hypothetical protein ACIRVF_07840 [Kitasatospora sp. NPDC101157]|uniref:hypothetical protein n=1 Tax=Kitasatospora sp. NPDC101157 TaxID=3364098 RepID=UPI0038272A6D
MGVFLIVAALVGFGLLGWFDWSARRRVQSVRATKAERFPYATFHTEEDGQ